jgi:hypothetical protein
MNGTFLNSSPKPILRVENAVITRRSYIVDASQPPRRGNCSAAGHVIVIARARSIFGNRLPLSSHSAASAPATYAPGRGWNGLVRWTRLCELVSSVNAGE